MLDLIPAIDISAIRPFTPLPSEVETPGVSMEPATTPPLSQGSSLQQSDQELSVSEILAQTIPGFDPTTLGPGTRTTIVTTIAQDPVEDPALEAPSNNANSDSSLTRTFRQISSEFENLSNSFAALASQLLGQIDETGQGGPPAATNTNSRLNDLDLAPANEAVVPDLSAINTLFANNGFLTQPEGNTATQDIAANAIEEDGLFSDRSLTDENLRPQTGNLENSPINQSNTVANNSIAQQGRTNRDNTPESNLDNDLDAFRTSLQQANERLIALVEQLETI